MKINHKGIQVTIDSEEMESVEYIRAEQSIKTCVDLYKEGRLKYMDLELKQEEVSWKVCEANIGITNADPSLIKYISSGDVDIDLSDTTKQVGYKL